MDHTAPEPREAGVRFFQTAATLVPDPSAGARSREWQVLAEYARQALVHLGWSRHEAGRAVRGLGVDELWAILRRPHPEATAPATGHAAGGRGQRA
jgi:hypothetical protein